MPGGLDLDALQLIRIRQMNGIRRSGLTIPEYQALMAQSHETVVQEAMARQGLVPGSPEATAWRAAMDAQTRGTDLDDPGHADHLMTLLDRVTETGTRTGQWTSPRPLIATERGGNINGYCFVDSAGTAAILIDSSLMTYAHLLAKVVAATLYEPGTSELMLDGEVFSERLHQQEPLWRLTDMLTAYVERGSTSGARPYWLDPVYDGPTDVMRDGMEEFIVAHECGHIQLGHASDPLMCSGDDMVALTQMIDPQTPVFLHRHRMELAADHFGLTMVLNGIDPDRGDHPLRLAGPFLFFLGLDLLDRMLFFYMHGRSMWERSEDMLGAALGGLLLPSTHPRPAFRCDYLAGAVAKSDLPSSFKTIAQFFSRDVGAALAKAEQTILRVVKDHASPDKVHPRWLPRQAEFTAMSQVGQQLRERMDKEGQTAGGSGAAGGLSSQ